MKVGERLRRWRKACGLTQAGAAEAAGISQSAWSELEVGTVAHISLDTAQRIVDVTSGEFSLSDFPRPRGKKVRPVACPDSSVSLSSVHKSPLPSTGTN